jgi:putative transcriptional regulator
MDPAAGRGIRKEVAQMKSRSIARPKPTAGKRIVRSLKEVVAWAEGRDVPVHVTTIHVPVIDVRSVRRKLRLSQSEFAAKFGFAAATLRNWEQGRSRPDGPARVLLAVLAKNPGAVEDALNVG